VPAVPSSIDVLTLRDRVETALAGELGSYVWQNAINTPAVKVESGIVQRSTQPQKVTGLEVAIRPYSQGDLQVYIGREIAFYDTYQIWLKQWDISKSVSTAFSTLLIALADIVTGHVDPIPRNTALDSLEQAALLVQYRRI
jgi:hypothetical protein